MGFAMGGLGLNVMHDANHGCFSKNKNINLILGNLMNLIGINPGIWKIQHNMLHHSYPNIQNYDEDLNMPAVLRMSPYTKPRYFHRYQQYYVWIIYLIGTLAKVVVRDFVVMNHLKNLGAFKNDTGLYLKKYAAVLFWKAIYFGYLVAVPLFFTTNTIGEVVLGFIIMHSAMGCSLVVINFLAHFSDLNEFINLPEEDNKISEDWAAHQLRTTTNFGTRSKFLTWFSGGLNYQVEHHLFPEISHIHYPGIAGIVEKTTTEYSLVYQNKETFWSALASHYRLLKVLGEGLKYEERHWKI